MDNWVAPLIAIVVVITLLAIAWKILVWSGGVELFLMDTLFSLLILIGGLLTMLKLLSLLSIRAYKLSFG